ncbi:origin of replication binding protein [Glomus cerebriforme]|uniref:Origin of replication binding protein n=1 Tax=Glomus cerebriforme TaxID=658196 RepID=A0A397SEB0_9GLOM|nr:origin of replication binding protein [Glomus cerebriforme]
MLLAQKNSGPCPKTINDAIRLFSGLADLDYEPGYNNHIYFQYLSNNNNDISLLGAYHSKEIFDKYIIQVSGKGFTVVNHLSEVYGIPDAHECIDGNLPLRLVLDIDARQKPDPMNPEFPFLDKYKITHEDLLFRILIACVDILYSDLNHLTILDAFALASLSNTNKCSWHIVYQYAQFVDYRDLRGFVKKVADRVGKLYSEFIDLELYKSHFSLQLLGSAKEDRVKRPAVSSTFSPEKPKKDEFQHIEDETALSKGAGLVTAKYEWLEIGHIRKGFVNFQAKSYKACPICGIKHERDQLYGFLRSNGHFVLKCYRQNQYKPDHKGLIFGEASGIIKAKERPKWELNDRDGRAPEAYPDLSSVCSTTLIRSPIGTSKTKALRGILNSLAGNRENLPCFIWVSYRKTLTNETKAKIEILQNLGLHVCQYQEVEGSLAISNWDVIIIQVESTHRIELHGRRSYVVILDEVNAVIRQMSSGVHVRESENTMQDLLKSAIHVVAMDAFANDSTIAFLKQYRDNDIQIFDNKYQPRIGETIKILYDMDKGSEAMRRGLKMLREGKHVAFAMTSCKKAQL